MDKKGCKIHFKRVFLVSLSTSDIIYTLFIAYFAWKPLSYTSLSSLSSVQQFGFNLKKNSQVKV